MTFDVLYIAEPVERFGAHHANGSLARTQPLQAMQIDAHVKEWLQAREDSRVHHFVSAAAYRARQAEVATNLVEGRRISTYDYFEMLHLARVEAGSIAAPAYGKGVCLPLPTIVGASAYVKVLQQRLAKQLDLHKISVHTVQHEVPPSSNSSAMLRTQPLTY